MFEGAASDPELARLAERMSAQRTATAKWIVDGITRLAPLRQDCSDPDAIDTVWVLMDRAVFDRLIRRRHWTAEDYQRWFATSVGRAPHPRLPPTDPDGQKEYLHVTSNDRPANRPHVQHGEVGYLQLPARDVAVSAAFYQAVFGWTVESGQASFEAPGMIGQWTTERQPATEGGPVVWICADRLWTTLQRILAHGGWVRGNPQLDSGERWLIEVDDPAGNRIGVVAPATAPQAQTLLAVRDVEASSRWYQQLLGLRSDHGGPNYERLVTTDGTLVLQLHHWDTEHDHGRIGDPEREVGNGVLVWFGETAFQLDGEPSSGPRRAGPAS